MKEDKVFFLPKAGDSFSILDTFLTLSKRVIILTIICKIDCQGNRHLATDETVRLKPVFMINNRLRYRENAGAVNTSGKRGTESAATHLIFSCILAHFFYTHTLTYVRARYTKLVNHNIQRMYTYICTCIYIYREPKRPYERWQVALSNVKYFVFKTILIKRTRQRQTLALCF